MCLVQEVQVTQWQSCQRVRHLAQGSASLPCHLPLWHPPTLSYSCKVTLSILLAHTREANMSHTLLYAPG